MSKELKDKYAGKSIKELAQDYITMRDLHDSLKREKADVWNEFDFLRRFMVEKMDEIGALTMNLDGIGRLEQRHNMSAKQLDPVALQTWLEDRDQGSLVKPTINSSSLSSFIRQELAEGREIPDDSVIELNAFDYVTIVKG